MPTLTKIDAARSILNLFSKIRIVREAENTTSYYPFPVRLRVSVKFLRMSLGGVPFYVKNLWFYYANLIEASSRL